MTRCGGVTTSGGGEVTPQRGMDETTSVRLTQIILSQKIKKIYVVDSIQVVDSED
jgi:hypothetical protein